MNADTLPFGLRAMKVGERYIIRDDFAENIRSVRGEEIGGCFYPADSKAGRGYHVHTRAADLDERLRRAAEGRKAFRRVVREQRKAQRGETPGAAGRE